MSMTTLSIQLRTKLQASKLDQSITVIVIALPITTHMLVLYDQAMVGSFIDRFDLATRIPTSIHSPYGNLQLNGAERR